MTKSVLVVCGASVATSTVIAVKIKELFKKLSVNYVEVMQCKTSEVNSKLKYNSNIDLIVSSTKVPGEINAENNYLRLIKTEKRDIPILSGLTFLTGKHSEETEDIIIKLLEI